MNTDIVQRKLFPEMEKDDEKTLFIIGNGFDLSHGIKSSYSNFKAWVENNKNNNLIHLMDIFFSNKRDVWGDIERALGEYDEESILDYCKPEENIDYDHTMRSVAAIEDSPDWIFKPVLEDFSEAFVEWIDSISLEGIKRVVNSLPYSSKFLTFNYTETLEKVYGIPAKNVLHIHGSRLLKDGYIFGHCHPKNPEDIYDSSELYFIEDTKSKIINWMNELEKDTEFIISSNRKFFEDLSDIENIIVYGHSFYEVDWPYLIEIIKHTDNSVPWKVSYHSNQDIENIDKFISKTGYPHITKFFM